MLMDDDFKKHAEEIWSEGHAKCLFLGNPDYDDKYNPHKEGSLDYDCFLDGWIGADAEIAGEHE